MKPRELSKLWGKQDSNSVLPLEPISTPFHHATLLPLAILALAAS